MKIAHAIVTIARAIATIVVAIAMSEGAVAITVSVTVRFVRVIATTHVHATAITQGKLASIIDTIGDTLFYNGPT